MESELLLEYTFKIKQQFVNQEKIEPNKNTNNNNSNTNNNYTNNNSANNNNTNNNADNIINNALNGDYFKEIEKLEKKVFKENKRKRRTKWNVIKNNNEEINKVNKDIIKYNDFNNNFNSNINSNSNINNDKNSNNYDYMDKFAGDFINNSEELNYLYFEEDFNKIPYINSQINKKPDFNEINEIRFKNTDEYNKKIDNILSGGGKKRRERKKKEKNAEEDEYSDIDNKVINKEKSKKKDRINKDKSSEKPKKEKKKKREKSKKRKK